MVTSFTSITDVVAYAVTVEVPLVRRELIPAAGDRADPVFTARGAWTLESIGGVLARILQSCAEAAATGKHELIARRTPDAGRHASVQIAAKVRAQPATRSACVVRSERRVYSTLPHLHALPTRV
jgi:hypothetical protein